MAKGKRKVTTVADILSKDDLRNILSVIERHSPRGLLYIAVEKDNSLHFDYFGMQPQEAITFLTYYLPRLASEVIEGEKI